MHCGIDVLAKNFRYLGYAGDRRTRLAMAEAVLAGEPSDRPATDWAPSADFNRMLDRIRDGRKLASIFFWIAAFATAGMSYVTQQKNRKTRNKSCVSCASVFDFN